MYIFLAHFSIWYLKTLLQEEAISLTKALLQKITALSLNTKVSIAELRHMFINVVKFRINE